MTRFMHTFLRRCTLAGVLTAGLAGLAPATTVVDNNLAQLVEGADKVFVGTVTDTRLEKSSGGWGERITVEVTEAVKNTTAGESVSWLQYRLGEKAQVPGMPNFEVGQSYLVYLSAPYGNSPFTAPVALGQGAFHILVDSKTGEAQARNENNNVTLYKGLDMTKLAPKAAPHRKDVRTAKGTAARQSQLSGLVAQSRALIQSADPVKEFSRPGGASGASAAPAIRRQR